MKRSPGPTPCSPLSISSAASASVELVLHAPRHARGQRVARALHAGQVDQHELRSRRCGATPRIARRVVCGRSETIATFSPTIALIERRLADVRPPGERDEAAARHGAGSGEQLALQREHLAVVGLVVHAEQVQHAVDDRLAQVGGVLAGRSRRRRARAAPLAGARRRRRSGTTARRSGSACRGARALSSAIRSRVDELDRHVAVARRPRGGRAARTGARSRSAAARRARAPRRDLDVDHRRSGAADRARSAGGDRPSRARARRAGSARRRPRRSAARACGARRPRRRSARTRCPRPRRARRRRRSAPTAARAAGRPA